MKEHSNNLKRRSVRAVVVLAFLAVLTYVAAVAFSSPFACADELKAAPSSAAIPKPAVVPSAAKTSLSNVTGSDTTTRTPELEGMSSDAAEIAAITGILPLYQQLLSEQSNFHNIGSDYGLKQHLRILYLHAKINQYLHTATLEANSVTGRLNSGMAQLADRKAIISDERARLLKRNTTINLVSGGLTKIGGYTSALTPASLIPTNVLEVFDGGVQVGLSAVNMKAQESERRFNKSKPRILTAFLSGSNNQNVPEFPDSVWAYLTVAKSGRTRRAVLMQDWVASGRLASGDGSKRRRSGTALGAPALRMDDLDDITSMMSDLKSVVAGMENSLMELSELLKISYEHDPEF